MLCAPVKGRIIPIEEVSDPTFAEKILGDGAAIIPDIGLIVAPADATVESIFDTGHAVNLTTDNGAELLIHVGIDTVSLKGRHFKALVKNGDKVKTGQPMIEFDLDKIKEEGFDPTTMVVVTNHENYAEIIRSGDKAVEKKPFLSLRKGAE